MKSKRYKLLVLLIVIWGLVASISSILLWRDNQRLKSLNQLLLKGIVTARDFAQNANEAYRTIGECVADYNSCDPQEAKDTLIQLDNEKDKINMELQRIDKELNSLRAK